MPRNGSNVYSPPADTLATTLTTIKSPNYNAFVNDVAADLNLARPIVSGGTGATSVASAQTALSLDNKVVYTTKSGNYTALAADNNAVHRYTAAATVTLTAAATLAANWHYTVIAGGGAVTIDPNGSETINGLATLVVPDGSSAEIISDGSNFFTIVRPVVWVPIGAPVTLSGQATVDWPDLGSFINMRMVLQATPSTTASLQMRFSTNNGSSFLSGAGDYANANLVQNGASIAGSGIATAAQSNLMGAASDSNFPATSTVYITNFNKNAPSAIMADTVYASGGSVRREFPYGYATGSTARNALRILTSAGNFASGIVTLEGIRG